MNCLFQCVDMPRSSLQAMGRAGRHKTELEFNEDLVLQRYLDLIQDSSQDSAHRKRLSPVPSSPNNR